MKDKIEKNRAKVLVTLNMNLSEDFNGVGFNVGVELPCEDNDVAIQKAQIRALQLAKKQAEDITNWPDVVPFMRVVMDSARLKHADAPKRPKEKSKKKTSKKKKPKTKASNGMTNFSKKKKSKGKSKRVASF